MLRQEVRRELLAEARKHEARKLLREIPFIGPIRAALVGGFQPLANHEALLKFVRK
jgi:transposase